MKPTCHCCRRKASIKCRNCDLPFCKVHNRLRNDYMETSKIVCPHPCDMTNDGHYTVRLPV